ncbi:MAG: 6-phosphogluconate dehydrogenase, decarboxylating [Candidatus Gottesmanbacteria bacterium GW2011_GWA1_42_26]|nr:MAG: 6-phosphogluconate dehydrogenase, decarboxylating [Candidatus Gottesmanbacteria bacterium GW2011_GWA1_42_26]
MQVAIIGLGRMGKNVTLHLLKQAVPVIAFNRSRDDVDEVVGMGATGAYTLEEIPDKFTEKPVVAILYLPSGNPIEQVLFGSEEQKGLADILPRESIIIDGGNSFYKDSQRRYLQLKENGMRFLDMGTSGGLEGARHGACLMVGGDEVAYEKVKPILSKIAQPDGYGYFGPSGAGHYVKMVHNAIEYGMMGSIGEGFNLVTNYESRITNQGKEERSSSQVPSLRLRDLPAQAGGQGELRNEGFKIDLAKLAKVWSHGSIVSGLLMDKAAAAFSKNKELSDITGEVPRGETEAEMEWLETTPTPHPVIIEARKERVATRSKPSFTGKVIAAMRREFATSSLSETSTAKGDSGL